MPADQSGAPGRRAGAVRSARPSASTSKLAGHRAIAKKSTLHPKLFKVGARGGLILEVTVDGKPRARVRAPKLQAPRAVANRIHSILTNTGKGEITARHRLGGRVELRDVNATTDKERRFVVQVMEQLRALQLSERGAQPPVVRVKVYSAAQKPAKNVPPPDDDSAFDAVIGPFYDPTGVALRLRIPVCAVAERAARHELLACPTAEGELVFPTFQFDDDGSAVAGLESVLSTMSRGTADSWQVALWMRTPSNQLKGATPYEALIGGKFDAVLRLAQQTAARWQR